MKLTAINSIIYLQSSTQYPNPQLSGSSNTYDTLISTVTVQYKDITTSKYDGTFSCIKSHILTHYIQNSTLCINILIFEHVIFLETGIAQSV